MRLESGSLSFLASVMNTALSVSLYAPEIYPQEAIKAETQGIPST